MYGHVCVGGGGGEPRKLQWPSGTTTPKKGYHSFTQNEAAVTVVRSFVPFITMYSDLRKGLTVIRNSMTQQQSAESTDVTSTLMSSVTLYLWFVLVLR